MTDLKEIPWGRLVMMMQSRADQFEEEDEVKEASFDQIAAFFGA